jgi:hypothetical protein
MVESVESSTLTIGRCQNDEMTARDLNDNAHARDLVTDRLDHLL